MTADELADTVLLAVALAHGEALNRPVPPAWQKLAVWEHEGDTLFGPRYAPALFGELAEGEAGRQRCRRAVARLEDAGLLEGFRSRRGRLERVRLTEAGWDRAEELAADPGADDGDAEDAQRGLPVASAVG